MCAALTKDEILNSEDCPLYPFDMTPYGWPGTVNIGMLKGADLQKARRDFTDPKTGKPLVEKDTDYVAYMASLFIRDENGQRIFDDASYKALSQKSGRALMAVIEKGNEVNNLAPDADKALEKNSGVTPSDGSTSA